MSISTFRIFENLMVFFQSSNHVSWLKLRHKFNHLKIILTSESKILLKCSISSQKGSLPQVSTSSGKLAFRAVVKLLTNIIYLLRNVYVVKWLHLLYWMNSEPPLDKISYCLSLKHSSNLVCILSLVEPRYFPFNWNCWIWFYGLFNLHIILLPNYLPVIPDIKINLLFIINLTKWLFFLNYYLFSIKREQNLTIQGLLKLICLL